jgi:hypothetical protein
VDESFYSFDWPPAEPEHPLGSAVVEYNGRDSVGLAVALGQAGDHPKVLVSPTSKKRWE